MLPYNSFLLLLNYHIADLELRLRLLISSFWVFADPYFEVIVETIDIFMFGLTKWSRWISCCLSHTAFRWLWESHLSFLCSMSTSLVSNKILATRVFWWIIDFVTAFLCYDRWIINTIVYLILLNWVSLKDIWMILWPSQQ